MITQRLDVQNKKLKEQEDELTRLRAQLAAAKELKGSLNISAQEERDAAYLRMARDEWL